METIEQKFAALQSPGQRDYQEDEFGLLDARSSHEEAGEHTVIVVADGMGGHTHGAKASHLATKAFIDAYEHTDGNISSRLHDALEKANTALARAIAEHPELNEMGSTLVAAVIADRHLHWISVGDSPLWVLQDGSLLRINADHSMAPLLAEMVANGKLSAEEAASDPSRHSLLSAVMGEEIELIDQSDTPFELQEQDLLLLASDGILSLSEDTISGLLKSKRHLPAQEIAQCLLDAVLDAQVAGQDNTTVAIYRPGKETPPPPAHQEKERPDAGRSNTGRAMPRHLLSDLYAWIGGAVIVLLIILAILYFNFSPAQPEAAAASPAPLPETSVPGNIATADDTGASTVPAAPASKQPSTGARGDSSGDASNATESRPRDEEGNKE